MKINEELAELIGAFIGDGFINKYGSSYHVEFSGSNIYDKEYYIFLSNIIENNFNIKPRIKYHEGALRLLITYKKMYEFFKFLGFPDGKKNDIVKIPIEIYNSPFVNNIIKGIFNTDGFIFLDKRKIYSKPYARIGFCTKSKALFEQVKEILIKNYKIYCRIDKRSQIYHLEIYGNRQVDKWMKEFGFLNKQKKNMPQWLSGRARAW